MVRRGSMKFVYSKADGPVLYDLSRDPQERRNLASSHTQGTGALICEAETRWDFGRIRADVIASQKQRRMIHAALTTGRIAPWDFAPRADAAAAYYRNYDPRRPDPERALRRPRPAR
jgi:choline-sulfatase